MDTRTGAGTAGTRTRLGLGEDSVGNPRRAQISQFELVELILPLIETRQTAPSRAVRGKSRESRQQYLSQLRIYYRISAAVSQSTPYYILYPCLSQLRFGTVAVFVIGQGGPEVVASQRLAAQNGQRWVVVKI